MLLATEELQNLSGVLAIGGLAEDLAATLCDRVAADGNSAIHAGGDVGGLLTSEADHQFLRGFAFCGSRTIAFCRIGRRDHREAVAPCSHELATARRAAGEDKGKVGHVGSIVPRSLSDGATWPTGTVGLLFRKFRKTLDSNGPD